MIAKVRELFADSSVRWLAAARIIPLAVAPISLWLLVTRQPLSSRGFYLIAINAAALAQLFETGMGTLVVQLTARARPFEIPAVRGAAERWFARAAVACAAIGAVVGVIIFANAARLSDLDFAAPWTVVVLCTATYVRLVPLVCMHEGVGDVDAVQRMRAVQAGAIACATLLGLWLGRGITAAAAAALVQLAVLMVYLWHSRPLPSASAGGVIGDQFREEQGKSARVWLALWAAPQLLTPLTMIARGASEAGQIGVHVALAFAPALLAIAWLHARYPRLGSLVASGQLRAFDHTARHALVQAMSVYALASLGVLALPFLLPMIPLAVPSRLLSPAMLALILTGNLATVLFQAMLAWFRAFGDEHFAMPVVIACVAMVIGAAGGAAFGGGLGAATGYAVMGVGGSAILAAGFLRRRSHQLAGV